MSITCSNCGKTIKKQFLIPYKKSGSNSTSGSTLTSEKSIEKDKKKKKNNINTLDIHSVEKNIIDKDQHKFILNMELSKKDEQRLNNLFTEKWKTTDTLPLIISSFLISFQNPNDYKIIMDREIFIDTLKLKIKESKSISKDQMIITLMNISDKSLFLKISKEIRYIESLGFHILYRKDKVIGEFKSDNKFYPSTQKAKSFLYTIYIDWYQSKYI